MLNLNGAAKVVAQLQQQAALTESDRARQREAYSTLYARLVAIMNRQLQTPPEFRAPPEAMSPMGRVAAAMGETWVETSDPAEVFATFQREIEPLIQLAKERKYVTRT